MILSEVDYYVLDYMLILIPFILAIIAQKMVDNAYNKGKMVNVYSRVNANDMARNMLLSNGISDVEVKMCRGHLTDHYDPRNKTLYLSDGVYDGYDASAIAIAAHEVGHAIQHAKGYKMLKLRTSMVGITNFASSASWVLIFIGLLFGALDLFLVGVILFGVVALFQLVTLPVELNASRRAYSYLTEYNILVDSEEKRRAKSVLRCAAFTYVVALLTSLAQILRYLLILASRRDRD